MELLRDELLRRARGEGAEDRNQARRQSMIREVRTDPARTRRFPRQLLLPHLAMGRRERTPRDMEAALESPKTPVVPSRRTSSPRGLPIVPQPAVLARSTTGHTVMESMAPPPSAEEAQRQADKRRRPKRFLFCFPFIKSPHVRLQLAICFVAAVFLFSLLAVCKWPSSHISHNRPAMLI